MAVFWSVVVVILYFLPLVIATGREHHQKGAIGVLNLFLGWTVIGWIAALIWAFTAVVKSTPVQAAEDVRACPHCAETIKAAAVLCKHCGQPVTAPTA